MAMYVPMELQQQQQQQQQQTDYYDEVITSARQQDETATHHDVLQRQQQQRQQLQQQQQLILRRRKTESSPSPQPIERAIVGQAIQVPPTITCPDTQISTPMESFEPYVNILVQPQSRALRFRYKCEGRYPGALTGVGTTNELKVYPSIRVENYVGKFVVVISCVTKDPPYYPHPHNIVSKEACKDGIYRNKFDKSDMTATFTSLGIQCVKKTEVLASLEERLKLRIDPFKTKYEHRNRPGDIDLNAVRLCFQVFLETERGCGRFSRELKPVVSDVIFDRKAMSDLQITKLSHSLAPLRGGLDMIVLCDKVSKDDIEVYFYQEDSAGNHLWEEKADITLVHKQVAVCFRSPNCSQNIPPTDSEIHMVKVQLRRSRVNELGEGRELYLKNVGAEDICGGGGAKRKRSASLQQNLQTQAALLAAQEQVQQQQQPGAVLPVIAVPRCFTPATHAVQHPAPGGQQVRTGASRGGHDLQPQFSPCSPTSDDSPVPSPPRWAGIQQQQPLLPTQQVLAAIGGTDKIFNGPDPAASLAAGGHQAHNREVILPNQPSVVDTTAVNEAAEKLDSLDISIPSGMNFSSDINLNNLNIDELQMSGPSATPVILSNVHMANNGVNASCHLAAAVAAAGANTLPNGGHGGPDTSTACATSAAVAAATATVVNSSGNLPLPGNFSESMFESGTSINQLDLLNSGQLHQLKQEED